MLCIESNHTDTVQWNVDDAAGGFFGNTAPAFFEPFDVEGVDRIVPAAGEVYGVPAKLSDMVGVPRVDTAAGTCVPDGLEVCSANERFKVVLDIDYPMDATPRFLDGPDDGLFYFFTPTGQEHLVRVLNGCNINGHYWVFAGGLTNIDYELTVTDTVSGSTQMFANTPGNAFDPIVDTQAFATCP